MAEAFLITNSRWEEPPRIRHQVARLLMDHGVRVAFFERPCMPWVRQPCPIREVTKDFAIVQTKCLLHAQLRVVPPIAWGNATFSRWVLQSRRDELGWSNDAVVINFLYDGAFLRDVFPRQRLITLIHDDFEAQSHFPWFGHVARALRATCQVSDQVLAVSTPLVTRLQQWSPCELFLPWAVRQYRAPRADVNSRKALLFWGSVDTAIDVDVVRQLSEECVRRGPDWKVLFVGPTERSDRRRRMTTLLTQFPQVEIHPATPLDDLPIDSILAAVIPYGGAPHTKAITMANKTMQLLACGLPLLISGMPAFLRQPFILRLGEDGEVRECLDRVRDHFADWQPLVQAFVESQSPRDRLRQLGFAKADSG